MESKHTPDHYEIRRIKEAYEADANKLMSERDYYRNLVEAQSQAIEIDFKHSESLRAEVDRLTKLKTEAHDHLAEIYNRYKSLMTAKINEKTDDLLTRIK